jgi:GTP cyclohydrolase IA
MGRCMSTNDKKRSVINRATPRQTVDHARVAAAVREILLAVGEDPDREGLRGTPERIARMYEELFSGLHTDPASVLKQRFVEKYDEMVLVKDITFDSVCEHHLLPFFGKAHVAYIPDGRILGLSKMARIVDMFARRLQVQERLTSQIADALMEHLEPRGVAVVVEARHLCMAMRGVEKQHSQTITSAMLGEFRENPRARSEFLSLLGREKR